MEIDATYHAEKLLDELKINTLPIDPFEIAKKYDIVVKAMPSEEGGISGAIIRVNNNFGILYATHIENENFQRFSISHELGHYFLPGHPEIVFSTDKMHHSRAGLYSSEQHEREADEFASGLLMPKNLFDRQLEMVEIGLDGIIKLSEICGTSITATAIRYIQRTPDPVAIVVSVKQEVDYCLMSDELKEYPGLSWLKKGSCIPNSTKTYEFNKDPENIEFAKRDDDYVDLSTWFDGNFEVELHEQVIGLGAYKKTLTVLSTSELPDLDEIQEEQDLMKNQKIRFRK